MAMIPNTFTQRGVPVLDLRLDLTLMLLSLSGKSAMCGSPFSRKVLKVSFNGPSLPDSVSIGKS